MSLEPADIDEGLDARAVDGEPFGAIVSALDELADDESLLLVNSFEPEPLYDVLEDRGYTYETTRLETRSPRGARTGPRCPRDAAR